MRGKKHVRRIIFSWACLALPWVGASVVYEGFDMESGVLGSGLSRSGASSLGWLSDWHVKEGQCRIVSDDLQMAGVRSAGGLLSSKGRTVAMRQLGETMTGDVFGSFRVRGSALKPNSMMGVLLSLPGADPLNPKTALVSFMATRWGSGLGGMVVGGKPVVVPNGEGLEAKETALVLWKISNLPEPGKRSDQVIQMWILNEAQVAWHAARGMEEKILTQAKQGRGAEEVLQSVRVSTRGSKLTLVKGLVLSCFSADVPKADFDEVRLSRLSLADAASVGASATAAFPAAASVTLVKIPPAPTRPPAREGSPDILFVLLDDLRWDALGFMDHPFVETPQIDSLRAQGAVMQNAFVTTSICCPSRATFLTGTLANRHGVIDNETSEYDPEATPPVTRYLQEAGYRTAMIGKWHMGNSGGPRPYFDFWLSFKGQGVYHDPLFNVDGRQVQHAGYTTDLLTDYTINFIREQPTDQPYFCMLSHKAVHEPFEPAARHAEAFGRETSIAEPESWAEDFADKPLWQRRQAARDVRWHYRTRDYEAERLPSRVSPERWSRNTKYVDQLRCLAAVDEGLGRIIETIRQRGTLDNTLIVFTSDNGYFHLEHRRWDKRLAYEESLRIPMIVVYPGHIEPGSTVGQLVTNADFAPTILEYAGLPVPPLMQGRSMKPLFEDPDSEWRDVIFYEYWKDLVHSIPTMTAVRSERHKLITYPEITDMDELYDLQSDPHEMNNLANDPAHAPLHAAMAAELEKARQQYGWRPDVFPKNLPRVRGPEGVLLDLRPLDGRLLDPSGSGLSLREHNIAWENESIVFNGRDSVIEVPFSEATDPSGWPFYIDLLVKPEADGIIAVQSTPGYGFKIFVQDGRPGVSVHCKTWIDTSSTLDGPDSIIGKWTRLEVLIDYNRLIFNVDGQPVESVSLPLPFKGSPKTPLVIGGRGVHPVAEGLPEEGFRGRIRQFTLRRGINP